MIIDQKSAETEVDTTIKQVQKSDAKAMDEAAAAKERAIADMLAGNAIIEQEAAKKETEKTAIIEEEAQIKAEKKVDLEASVAKKANAEKVAVKELINSQDS